MSVSICLSVAEGPFTVNSKKKNKRHPQYLRNRQHRHAAKDPNETQKTKSGKSRGGPKKHEIPWRRN